MESLLLVILSCLIIILFTIMFTRKNKEKEIFETFKTTFLPLIEILENRRFPKISRSEYTQFFDKMIVDQETAFLNVKVRLNRKRRDIINQKWEEYKKKFKPYKERSFIAFLQFEQQKDKFSGQQLIEDDNLLNLINEIFKIAKHN